MEWCFRAKKICSKIDCEVLIHANLTKLIGSLYLTPRVNFYSSKNSFKKFWLVNPLNTAWNSSHNRRPNLQGEGNANVQEEVNSLKAEVDTLKNTLKMLISIREESEHMLSYIRDIKVEIHILTKENLMKD